jgi:hypothetical protein
MAKLPDKDKYMPEHHKIDYSWRPDAPIPSTPMQGWCPSSGAGSCSSGASWYSAQPLPASFADWNAFRDAFMYGFNKDKPDSKVSMRVLLVGGHNDGALVEAASAEDQLFMVAQEGDIPVLEIYLKTTFNVGGKNFTFFRSSYLTSMDAVQKLFDNYFAENCFAPEVE